MKNIILISIIAISFTGCYTSFAPRDYEEDSFGQIDNYYYDSEELVSDTDSSEFYYPEDEYYSEDGIGGVTVINNYGSNWDWGYNSPYYSSIYTSYGYYDPFFDPYYAPYGYPYYSPYYGANYYIYGDYYGGSGYGYYNYPSSVRYRTTRHWTSLRNNGGRGVATRGRDVNRTRTPNIDTYSRDDFRTVKGFNLDRDLRVSKLASVGVASNRSGLRTAGYSKDGNRRTRVKRTTDLERRRVSNKFKNSEVIRESNPSKDNRAQKYSKKSRVISKKNNSTSKRSKRVYSSNKVAKNKKSSRNPSRTYYNPPGKKGKSSKVSKPSKRSSSNSSSYSSNKKSSRNNSSRSSVSRSHGSSSSRSSISRSSGRSSNSSRSTSGRSSRRR